MPLPLLPLMIGMTALSTLGKFAGNIQASKVAKRNTNLTIAENKKQAELAYQRELENISAMNKYNSPESQMLRFKQAKLNPALIYSQGSPGNQTQFAKYNAPRLEYNYVPKFKGDEFEAIKNLPLAYAQVNNLMAIGKSNEAKSVMESALSKYADMLARNKALGVMNQGQKDRLEFLLGSAQIERMFIRENDTYILKPEYAETLVQSIVDKWTKTSTELGKSQVDLQLKERILKNLSIVPFLQPLIQFLKLF